MTYTLAPSVTAEMLQKEGFKTEKDDDGDGNVVVVDYTKTFFSKKVKGAYVPFVSIGYVVIDADTNELWIDRNPSFNGECNEQINPFIQNLIDKKMVIVNG